MIIVGAVVRWSEEFAIFRTIRNILWKRSGEEMGPTYYPKDSNSKKYRYLDICKVVFCFFRKFNCNCNMQELVGPQPTDPYFSLKEYHVSFPNLSLECRYSIWNTWYYCRNVFTQFIITSICKVVICFFRKFNCNCNMQVGPQPTDPYFSLKRVSCELSKSVFGVSEFHLDHKILLSECVYTIYNIIIGIAKSWFAFSENWIQL